MFFFIVGCNQSSVGFSQETPEEWYKRLIESKKLDGQKSFPHNLIFVEKLPKNGPAKFKKDIDQSEFDGSGFFRIVSAKSVEWNFILNKKRYSKAEPQSIIFRNTEADTIIDTGNKWTMFHKSAPGKPLIVLGEPENESVTSMQSFLIDKLGWDGVILDVKKNMVLVGSTAEILSQPEIQALAIEDSAQKLFINAKDRKGAGLLSLQKFSNGLGIFDVVFLGKGKNSIQPGTKLIIERKK